MSKEKQIEETAMFMCNCYDEGYCRMDGKLCDLECGSYKESETFYEAGCRKQSEVAREILAEIDRMCVDTFGNFNHKRFAEIKEKYTGAKMKGE